MQFSRNSEIITIRNTNELKNLLTFDSNVPHRCYWHLTFNNLVFYLSHVEVLILLAICTSLCAKLKSTNVLHVSLKKCIFQTVRLHAVNISLLI